MKCEKCGQEILRTYMCGDVLALSGKKYVIVPVAYRTCAIVRIDGQFYYNTNGLFKPSDWNNITEEELRKYLNVLAFTYVCKMKDLLKEDYTNEV